MSRRISNGSRALKLGQGRRYALTTERLIDEKITVLEEFYVVNSCNENAIRERLKKAVEAAPKSEPAFILDRVAREMIMASFN